MARRLVIAVEGRGLSHSSRFIPTALGAESKGMVVLYHNEMGRPFNSSPVACDFSGSVVLFRQARCFFVHFSGGDLLLNHSVRRKHAKMRFGHNAQK